VVKPWVQAAEDVEDEDPVVDRRLEIGQSIRHVLEIATVLAHVEITLHKVTEGNIKVKGALLTVTEKLVLDSEPQVARGGTTFLNHLMELRGDRVADPVEDDAVHPAPARIDGRRDVRVDVVEEGIALEYHHHQVTPAGVGDGGGVKDDVHKGTNVVDSRWLEVKTGDDGLLIGIRGRRHVGGAKRRAWHKLASSDGGLLQGDRRLLLLLQEGACGPGTAECSNRLLFGFLGVIYEGVEFDFEGGGVGDDVSWFGAHAGVEVENLVAAIRVLVASDGGTGGCGPTTASASGRRLVAAASVVLASTSLALTQGHDLRASTGVWRKNGAPNFGAGPRILISEAKFVGSPGDAITLFTFWQFVSVFK
jgi:hypothetical protein